MELAPIDTTAAASSSAAAASSSSSIGTREAKNHVGTSPNVQMQDAGSPSAT